MFYILVTDKGFSEIFAQYRGYSYTVCKNTVERRIKKYDFPRDEIKDIIQISFTKLFLYIRKTDKIENMKSLIARITELTTINYLDKYIRDTGRFVPDYSAIDDGEEEEIPDPLELIIDDESFNELTDLIKNLDIRFASVILLNHVHDMSFKEIAELVQIPYSTICSWHTRGKRILAKKLSEKREREKDAG